MVKKILVKSDATSKKNTFSKSKTGRGITGKRSFNWITKDESIDAVRTVIEASGMSYIAIEKAGGAKVKTMYGWFRKDVKRPQFYGLRKTVRACGGDFFIRTSSGDEIKLKAPKK